MKTSKLWSAPDFMRFDGDDIHVLVAMVSFGIDKGEQMRCWDFKPLNTNLLD